ncbi:MAG: rhodanese-like domain-containing protein [Chloroflexota bacterium]
MSNRPSKQSAARTTAKGPVAKGPVSPRGAAPRSAKARSGRTAGTTGSTTPWIVGSVIAIVAVIAIAVIAMTGVLGKGGSWTDITPDRLAIEMQAKSFTLLNVKTPYIGEIAGTDLYMPFDTVAARASDLPADKTAKIVVYCRTGRESAIAARALVDLGYTNIENLAGGMEAWTASGRSLVNLGRS